MKLDRKINDELDYLRIHRAETHKDRKKVLRRSVKEEAKAFRRDLDEGGLT